MGDALKSQEMDKPKLDAEAETKQSSRLLIITAVCIGNFLEIFDFTVYGFFSVYIGKVFFSNLDQHGQLLVATTLFGIGFLARPLGALFIGGFADKYGSKAGLTLCIALMGLGSALIVVAPTPALAGITGVVFIIVARLLQGFSAGGEIGSGLSMLIDYSSAKSKDFVAAWQMAVQGLSGILGAGLGFVLTSTLTQDQIVSWAWRIPFVICLLIVPVGMYIRKNTVDKPQDESVAREKSTHLFSSIKHLFKHYYELFFLMVLISGAGSSTVYILKLYLPSYLSLVPVIDISKGYFLVMLGSFIAVIAPLFIGFVIDKISKGNDRSRIRRKILLINWSVLFIGINVTFLSTAHPTLFIVAYLISFFALSIHLSVSLVFGGEAFPRHIRATGIAFSYAACVTLFGGPSQILVTLALTLSDNLPYAPLFYLSPLLLLCLLGLLRLKPLT